MEVVDPVCSLIVCRSPVVMGETMFFNPRMSMGAGLMFRVSHHRNVENLNVSVFGVFSWVILRVSLQHKLRSRLWHPYYK
jgi:hypothetical protein